MLRVRRSQEMSSTIDRQSPPLPLYLRHVLIPGIRFFLDIPFRPSVSLAICLRIISRTLRICYPFFYSSVYHTSPKSTISHTQLRTADIPKPRKKNHILSTVLDNICSEGPLFKDLMSPPSSGIPELSN